MTGRYWWSDDADQNAQVEGVSECSWLDGKKTVGIYIELDGFSNVAGDEFRVENDETNVSVTIASVDGKRKTFLLTGLASETAGIEVAQKERKQVIDETMVFVGVDDVGEKFDDVERMTARFGEKGITEDCCARSDEESAQGFQVYVEDFGGPRVETNGAGLLIEDEGMKIDTSGYVAKEEHQQCSRCETCSLYVNKSCFGFWDSFGVNPDFAESGADEFDASAQAVSEVSTHEQSAEGGNVKRCYMGFWDRELVDSGSGHEGRTRVDDGRRRREATTGGRNKIIYVEQGKKVRQMSEEELVEWMKNGGDNAFVVHDGKVVTAETVSRLKDSAMIRLVNRLPGGGRKKKTVPKSTGGEDLSATEESSSSTLSSDQSAWMARVNEVFRGDAVEQMKSIASTGPGGWTEAWAKKVMEVGEEGEEEILIWLLRGMWDEFGHVVAKKMIKGVRDFVREQKEGAGTTIEGKEAAIEEEG